MPKAIDFIRMVQRGEAPPPPVARLIGFTLTEMEPGRAVIALDADGRHANPMGTLHGGILCDIADAAMGMAYAAGLARGHRSRRQGRSHRRPRRVRRAGRQGAPRRARVQHLYDPPGRAGGGALG